MRVTNCVAVMLLICASCSMESDESLSGDLRGGHGHKHDAGVIDSAPSDDAPTTIADAPLPPPDASLPPPPDAAMPPPDATLPPPDAAMPPPNVGPYFATSMFFNRDVSGVTKAATSDSIIATLKAEGGWGNGNVMQIDYALDVLTATNATPMRTFTTTSDFFSPDCDHVAVPIPAGGNIEDESGYACTTGGDCHLIVYQRDTKQLYEMWRANITSTTFYGGCLAVWNGMKTYTDVLRGDQCTSADAAGYPIAPLLFNADEVAAGHIDHAIRFILPNDRVRRGYTRPATHGTSTTGVAGAPYYGVHLRLRANYPIASLPTEGARVVARAMQKYGMYHADGGNIALTAQSDRHTTAKWAGLLGSHDLAALKVEDFEVIDHGSSVTLTGDCVRTP
jgi:serine/threonine-protein kinase